jgi:hypothetical protein
MKPDMTFEELRNILLYRTIVKWQENTIELDNGVVISIMETAQDCCATADGVFDDVVLDAAITNVSNIHYEPWENSDTYGCSATVTIMHNRNVICKAVADADAGNGGYYYSIASFVVNIPNQKSKVCTFVSSDDK